MSAPVSLLTSLSISKPPATSCLTLGRESMRSKLAGNFTGEKDFRILVLREMTYRRWKLKGLYGERTGRLYIRGLVEVARLDCDPWS